MIKISDIIMYIHIFVILTLFKISTAIKWDPGCGKTKGCFPNCPNGCQYLVTWEKAGTTGTTFSLQAEETDNNKYLAIGFSNDQRMGDDSVVACSMSDSKVSSYYNDDTESNLLSPSNLGITSPSVTSNNGVISCLFTRSYKEANDLFFDLNNEYILMLVIGDTENKDGATKIRKHYMIPWSSDTKVNFKSTNIYDVYKLNSSLVKLHGIMMIFAWLFFSTIGIVTARYNKDMLSGRKLLGTNIWFQVHRGVMVTTLLFVVVGFISIFVENMGYSQITPPKSREAVNVHPVLGIIVTVLCFLNPFLALFRPSAEHDLRWLFNWVHFGIGILTQLLAVVTIFLGYYLERAMQSLNVVYVTVSHVVVTVIVGVVLEAYTWTVRKRKIETLPGSMEFRERTSSIEPSTVAFTGLVIYSVSALGFIIGIASIIGGS